MDQISFLRRDVLLLVGPGLPHQSQQGHKGVYLIWKTVQSPNDMTDSAFSLAHTVTQTLNSRRAKTRAHTVGTESDIAATSVENFCNILINQQTTSVHSLFDGMYCLLPEERGATQQCIA